MLSNILISIPTSDIFIVSGSGDVNVLLVFKKLEGYIPLNIEK